METRTRPHDAAPDDAAMAYPISTAARRAGVSVRTLRYAIERGDLIVRRPSTRPVILAADLLAWLEASPTDRAAAPRRPATGRAA